MSDNRIAYIYQELPATLVTGGHIYDRDLITTLSDRQKVDILIAGPMAKLLAPVRNLRLLKRLADYDIIIFNSSKALYFLPLAVVLRLTGKKTMAIHHCFLHEDFKGIKRLLYRTAESAMLRAVRRIISPSPYVSDQIRKRLGKEPVYVPIPFDEPASNGDLNPITGNLLYAATIEPGKGLRYLLEAMVMLKERGISCRLDIAGKVIDESYAGEMRKIVAENSLDAVFHGRLPRNELHEMMKSSDIFVFPSLHEGYGMAPNEAMGHGLPVIAFDNSAIPYSVRSGDNGLLVATGDTAALAAAIGWIITDRDLRSRLSAGATAHARRLPRHSDFEASLDYLLSRTI